MKKEPIAVLGAGAWGSALAFLLARNEQIVHLWDIDQAHIKSLQENQRDDRHFPSVSLPENIKPTLDLSEAIKDVQDILIVVPSHAFSKTIESIKTLSNKKHRIAWGTKGIDPNSATLFDEVVKTVLGEETPTAILSGPSFAKEVVDEKPTHVVLASQDKIFSEDLHHRFHNDYFKLEHTQDITGVQLCSALKNVLAILIGICDGLGFGTNAKCALITKGLKQMQDLGKSLGAQVETFTGLAGLGDIVLTSTDNQSRNRRFGYALGVGASIEQAEEEINQTVEGKITTENAYDLIQKHQTHCPFVEELYDVLYQNKAAKLALKNLL